MIFIDLRDNYGITQCVVEASGDAFAVAETLRHEFVISVDGRVVARSAGHVNNELATGAIEVVITGIEVLSHAEALPFSVNGTQEQIPEEQRLRYRFLDLRRDVLHDNIILRSNVIASLRRRMIEQGFREFQTPILTSSSPEGARDYLVPSRVHPGKFYALPQAPQQFKQLLMVAGFDRYFQIAPCFRDEDARADRSPGEFYQLDLEMSFVEQDDIFAAIEPVLHGVYQEFSDWEITPAPFPRITFDDALLWYGTDKPDLRNPIKICDVTSTFQDSNVEMFARAIKAGAVVRAIPAPGAAAQSRKFFDNVVALGQKLGLPGVAYVIADEALRGPLAKFLSEQVWEAMRQQSGVARGDALFVICAPPNKILRPLSELRMTIGRELSLVEQRAYRFCWIVDFPFYERDSETQQVAFSHNPFSMPKGGLEALDTQDPLTIKATQYDIVCNGMELSSGAIRNHRPDIMIRAFEIAGYSRETVEERFGGLLQAFRYGAPPHGGLAPGVDRIVMQLADVPNLREVVAFPMTQNAEDLMMNAPSPVTEKQLRELNIRIVEPQKKAQS